MRGHHFVLAAALAACGGGQQAHVWSAHEAQAVDDAERADARAHDAEPASGPEVPYDRAVQKSVHNAYDRYEPLIDQLVYHRVRSLELDVHVRREGVAAPAGDWFVYHEDNPLMRRTSCARLSDCLGQLRAFHAAVPEHEVVTVFVDLKDPFERGHEPADLDAAIIGALGRESVVTPADLVARCPGAESARDAVTGACGFPTLGALRGKFLVATTGGSACDAASPVARYGGPSPLARAAFLAPAVGRACPVETYDARPDVVFFNMGFGARAEAAKVRARGLVARVYGGPLEGGLDDPRSFAEAWRLGGAHLATNRVNIEADGWASTHLAGGFPFTCDGCAPSLVEPGGIVGLRATSGDQGGAADSGYFALETDAGDTTWSALVSVPSSHVEPFAKACLVARAGLEPGAPSVSVCRTFDDGPPRAQIRRRAGAAAEIRAAPSFAGLRSEAPAFLRLAVEETPSGGAAVTASASRDGKAWKTITKATLPTTLPYRGVAVSSHGSAPVKGLFADLVRARNGKFQGVESADLTPRAIGALATGELFDGAFAGDARARLAER